VSDANHSKLSTEDKSPNSPISNLMKAAAVKALRNMQAIRYGGRWPGRTAYVNTLCDESIDAIYDALDKETAQHIHGVGCWSWGTAHYACACAEIAKLRGWHAQNGQDQAQ
jgi:hypothetical protein